MRSKLIACRLNFIPSTRLIIWAPEVNHKSHQESQLYSWAKSRKRMVPTCKRLHKSSSVIISSKKNEKKNFPVPKPKGIHLTTSFFPIQGMAPPPGAAESPSYEPKALHCSYGKTQTQGRKAGQRRTVFSLAKRKKIMTMDSWTMAT